LEVPNGVLKVHEFAPHGRRKAANDFSCNVLRNFDDYTRSKLLKVKTPIVVLATGRTL
jgi:hypothetical protein